MSKRNRGAFIATGLVAGFLLGVGLALLFLVWAVPEFRDPTFTNEYYERWQPTTADNQDKQDQNTRMWVRGLHGWVYSEDTAAQWLMAVLGISATVISFLALIWLKATWAEAKRAADTAEQALNDSRLGAEAQNARLTEQLRIASLSVDATINMQRPWLRLDVAFRETITLGPGGKRLSYTIVASNMGKNPALDVRIVSHPTGFEVLSDPYAQGINDIVAKAKRGYINHPILFPNDVVEEGGYAGSSDANDPMIYACAAYKIVVGGDDRFTALPFRLHNLNAKGFSIPFAETADDGVVSAAWVDGKGLVT